MFINRGLLKIRANLEDQHKRILIAVTREDGLYEKVKHTLLNLFGKERKTKGKEEVWMIGTRPFIATTVIW